MVNDSVSSSANGSDGDNTTRANAFVSIAVDKSRVTVGSTRRWINVEPELKRQCASSCTGRASRHGVAENENKDNILVI